MDKHYKWVTPIFNPGSIVLIIIFLILIAVLIRRKKHKAAIAIISGLALMLITLGIPKFHDADYTVYYSYERFYLAVPHLLALGLLLLYLDEETISALRREKRIGGSKRGQLLEVTQKHKYIFLLFITIILLAYMGYRHITLAGDVKMIMGEGGMILDQDRVTDVVSISDDLAEISAGTGAELVVFSKRNTLLNYALAALHKGEIKTISAYERRFWRLREESEKTRPRFLIYNTPKYKLKRSDKFKGTITTIREEPVPIFMIENHQTNTIQAMLDMGFRIEKVDRLLEKRKSDEISCSLSKN